MTETNIDLSRFINKGAAGKSGAAEEKITMPLVLENVLRYCLKDASERMEKGEEIAPFSALAVGETLFMEEHQGETPEDSFAAARKTVENARGALAYGFCYDGYIEVGEKGDMRDCLIVEGGCPGEPYGHAIGLPYTVDAEGAYSFLEEPIYLSKASNYMLSLFDIESGDEEEAEAAE